jgi:iron-sulfur cluster assembly accessory protein
VSNFFIEDAMNTLQRTTTISLTTAAAEAVRELLSARNLDGGYALRVFISGQSCSGFQYGMGFDNKPAETDTAFETEGLKILVDEASLQYMSGTMIDYINDERGKGFLVDNPNSAPSCSCGEGNCSAGEN